MTTNASVNMDARWLRGYAEKASLTDFERATFIRIADHIDSMEEKLRWAGDYHQGWLDGRAAQHSHSNILTSREITPTDGQIIAQALANGKVTRVPRGVSGLPPEPPYKPKAAKPRPKAEPVIHIDLKDL